MKILARVENAGGELMPCDLGAEDETRRRPCCDPGP